jgi:hypothetical protein
MINFPDIWKIYFFILLGMGIGYLGSFDQKNFFILGVPTVLLIKNTQFDCYTNRLKYEKQKTLNHSLNIVRDMIDVFRTWNTNNVDEATEKIKEIFSNVMQGMDINSLVSTGISAFINSQINN